MARTWATMKLVVVLTMYTTFLSANPTVRETGNATCRVTQDYFRTHGILVSSQGRSNVPPQSSRGERICLSKVNSCCPNSTQAQIYSKATADLTAHFRMVIEPQRDFIHLFMHSFKQRTLKAINSSAERTAGVFTHSYGLVYKRNQEPISDFYRTLYNFVDEATERTTAPSRQVEQIFFDMRDLLRRTLLGIYGDYSKAGNNYVPCMLEMIRTQPQPSRVTSEPLVVPSAASSDWFGEDADKLEKLAVRTLMAVRTILTSLERLRTILDELATNIPVSESCKRAFAGLRHCAPCSVSFNEPPISGSLASLAVCPTSCLAFREVCFNISRDFLDAWNSTFDILLRVFQNYESSWNVQSLVEQMPVSMSSMVMNFQQILLEKVALAPYSSCLNDPPAATSSSLGRQKRAAPQDDSAQTQANVKRRRKTTKASLDSSSTPTPLPFSATNSSTTSTTRPTSTTTTTTTPSLTRATKTRRKQTRDFVIGKNNMPTIAPSTVASSSLNTTAFSTTLLTTYAMSSTSLPRASTKRERLTTVSAETSQSVTKGGKKDRGDATGQNDARRNARVIAQGNAVVVGNMTYEMIVSQLTRTRQIWSRLTNVCNPETLFVQVSLHTNRTAANSTTQGNGLTSLGDVCWNGSLHVAPDANANVSALAQMFAKDWNCTPVREPFRSIRARLNKISHELVEVDVIASPQRREHASPNSIQVLSRPEVAPTPTDLNEMEDRQENGRGRSKANKKPPASSLPDEKLPDGSGTDGANVGTERDTARPTDDEIFDGSGSQTKRCPNPDDEDCTSKQNRNLDDVLLEGSADSEREEGSASPDTSDIYDFESVRRLMPTAPRIAQTTTVVVVQRTNVRAPSADTLFSRGATAAPLSRTVLFLGCTAFVRLLSRFLASA